MTATLVVEPGPFRWRIGRIVHGELDVLRVVDIVVGIEDDLFKARITALATDLGGVFADLGRGAGAFVRLPRRLRHPMPELGRSMLVQGVRDAKPDKAARATPSLRLDGSLLAVLSTGAPGAAEGLPPALARALRTRAKTLFGEAPVVLEAAAADASDADLLLEAAALSDLLDDVRERFAARSAVGPLLDEDERLALVLRSLSGGVTQAICGPAEALRSRRLLEAAGVEARVMTAPEPWAEAGVEGGLAVAHDAEIPLAGGGTIVVEPTQAVVAVDVDRGAARDSVAQLNARALQALRRALRVRALGGQIVVDFLEPEGPSGVASLRREVEQALAPLGAHVRVLLASGLCVLERQQRRIPLAERSDPTLDAAERLLGQPAGRALLRVAVAADIDDLLQEPNHAAAARRWLDRHGAQLETRRDPSLPRSSFVEEEAST